MSCFNDNQLDAVVRSLRAHTHLGTEKGAGPSDAGTIRFVTISRQAGIDADQLASALVKAIKHRRPELPEPWCAWDKALVEKVAREHHIRDEFVELLEDANHPWFAEFIASLYFPGDPGELAVFRRVAVTVRGLAQGGRAVIVGRGGVFLTAGLPGGIHVRLVAPVQYRIRSMAECTKLARAAAALKVREIDRNRAAFYRRYWPGKKIQPETFTVTFNTAEVADPQIVACLLPLVLGAANSGACNQNLSSEVPEKKQNNT